MDATTPALAIPDNPFAAACEEGSPLTYLALAKAGLAQSFNPLPRDANGLGLASLMLGAGPNRLTVEAFDQMIAFGLDPSEPCLVPERGSGFTRFGAWAHLRSAPLACFALGLGWTWAQKLWRMLDDDKLLACAPQGLPLACAAGNLEGVQALLRVGADPNARDGEGMPVCSHCADHASLRLLTDAGADLRAPFPKEGWDRNLNLLDRLMGDKAQTPEAKAMRALAVEWAKKHPAQGESSAQTLASAAFAALACDNKPAARSCVLELGQDAPNHRDANGDSLLIAATRAGNLPEANRLIGLGCDPFEVSPGGQSAWGLALLARERANGWRSRFTDRERADGMLANIESKPKRRPIPWTGPTAPALAQSIALACGPHMSAPRLLQSAAAGFSMRKPWPCGLDAACFFAARAIGAAGAAASVVSNDDLAALDFLKQHPPEQSHDSCKAALASAFLNWLGQAPPKNNANQAHPVFGSWASRARDHRVISCLAGSQPDNDQEPSSGEAEPSSGEASLAELLLEGAKAAARLGMALPPSNASSPGDPLSRRAGEALALAFETQAIECSAKPAAKSAAALRI